MEVVAYKYIHTCFLIKEQLFNWSLWVNFLHAADTYEDWFVCLAALCSWSLITESVLCADCYVFGSLRVLNR